MRKTLLPIILCSCAFGHGGAEHDPTAEQRRFGAFADLQYRTDTLYPFGPLGSYGHETHGNAKRVEAEHAGLFAYGPLGKGFDAALELNHHVGAGYTPGELVERAYAAYRDGGLTLRGGRVENALSFLALSPWGYGFSQMPLGLMAYTRDSLYGDGGSVSYSHGNWRIDADALNDQYSKTNRFTLRGVYKNGGHTLVAYVQRQNPALYRFDGSANHSHSHGSGCDNLQSGELCFDAERTLLGAGYGFVDHGFSLQGELLHALDEGTVRSTDYLVERDTKHTSAYAQLRYRFDAFESGFRFEHFWFSNTYEGNGATALTALIEPEGSHSGESLSTLLLAWHPFEGHTFRCEYESDDSSDLVRLQYLLRVLW